MRILVGILKGSAMIQTHVKLLTGDEPVAEYGDDEIGDWLYISHLAMIKLVHQLLLTNGC